MLSSPIPRVAIVGGGLAGLTCARALVERGVDVVVFDKGRAAGGRLATRRVPPFAFDLGAQYFTVRGARFARLVHTWRSAGIAAPWTGRIASIAAPGDEPAPTAPLQRFVGTPGMSALARYLAREVDVRASTRVDRVERAADGLRLFGTRGTVGTTLPPTAVSERAPLGTFDALVIAIPPGQARALLADASAALADVAAAATMEPCVALGVAFAPDAAPSRVPFDGLFVGRAGEHALGWIARDSSKPGRPRAETWVAHASPRWSATSWGATNEELTARLVGELARIFGLGALAPIATTLQRWAFARPGSSHDAGAWVDEDARIVMGGDWAAGGRVEGAVESGWALAERVLGREEPRVQEASRVGTEKRKAPTTV